MKFVIYLANPQNTGAGGQMAVKPQYPGPLGAHCNGIKMGYLAQCMNSAVCPAAAGHPDIMVCNPGQRTFNTSLYGRLLGLDLPAQKGASVVFHSYRITHFLASLNRRKEGLATTEWSVCWLLGPVNRP